MNDRPNPLQESQHKSSSSELRERIQSLEAKLAEIRERLSRVRASLEKLVEYLNRSERTGR
jgi:predicted nuclease with TOPRIM domain